MKFTGRSDLYRHPSQNVRAWRMTSPPSAASTIRGISLGLSDLLKTRHPQRLKMPLAFQAAPTAFAQSSTCTPSCFWPWQSCWPAPGRHHTTWVLGRLPLAANLGAQAFHVILGHIHARRLSDRRVKTPRSWPLQRHALGFAWPVGLSQLAFAKGFQLLPSTWAIQPDPERWLSVK